MKKIALLITLSSVCCFAQAQKIFGVVDCGQWVNDRVPAEKEFNKGWLLGYLSGLNLGNPGSKDQLLKVNSADQIFLWMDNYCRANPLQKVRLGADALFEELERRR